MAADSVNVGQKSSAARSLVLDQCPLRVPAPVADEPRRRGCVQDQAQPPDRAQPQPTGGAALLEVFQRGGGGDRGALPACAGAVVRGRQGEGEQRHVPYEPAAPGREEADHHSRALGLGGAGPQRDRLPKAQPERVPCPGRDGDLDPLPGLARRPSLGVRGRAGCVVGVQQGERHGLLLRPGSGGQGGAQGRKLDTCRIVRHPARERPGRGGFEHRPYGADVPGEGVLPRCRVVLGRLDQRPELDAGDEALGFVDTGDQRAPREPVEQRRTGRRRQGEQREQHGEAEQQRQIGPRLAHGGGVRPKPVKPKSVEALHRSSPALSTRARSTLARTRAATVTTAQMSSVVTAAVNATRPQGTDVTSRGKTGSPSASTATTGMITAASPVPSAVPSSAATAARHSCSVHRYAAG